MHMDDLDHRLLHLLTRDARASATQLAAKLGVSRGTIQNRIDRMVHTKVIHRFTVELGEADTDHQVSAFTLIKLQADDGRATIAALRRQDEIIDIHTLSGSFDIVAELRTSSLKKLDQALDRIRAMPEVAETQSHIRLSAMS